MTIGEIVREIDGKVRCGEQMLDREIQKACSSDLLSDVLTLNKSGILLITGVANLQTIRTAEMAEISCVMLVRNKRATKEMLKLANDTNLVIIESRGSMFGISGKLFEAGLQPLY